MQCNFGADRKHPDVVLAGAGDFMSMVNGLPAHVSAGKASTRSYFPPGEGLIQYFRSLVHYWYSSARGTGFV